MHYTDFFNDVRNKVNIVEIISQFVNLKKQNKEYVGLCPFHNEKTPSFKVQPAKNFYHCFGCGAHGDAISFVSKNTGLSYKEAAIKLAGDNSIPVPKFSLEQQKIHDETEKIHHTLELANSFFKNSLDRNCLEYLSSRGIDQNIINKFEIGFAKLNELRPNLESLGIDLREASNAGLISKDESNNIYEVFRNRITFPIRNRYNKIIGFGGRLLNQNNSNAPKYLNSPETLVFKKNTVLYAENLAISHAYKTNNIIVVEGYMDCITLHKYGFENTVATLGTAINENQILDMWKIVSDVTICMDGDEAGIKASKRVIELVLKHVNSENQVSFVIVPNDMDPDEFLTSYGKNGFSNLLEGKMSLSEMIWYTNTHSQYFKTAEQRAKLESDLQKTCDKISNETLQKNYSRFFKQKCWELFISKEKPNVQRNVNTTPLSFIQNSTKVDFEELDAIEYSVMALIMQNYQMLLESSIILDQFIELNFNNSDINKLKEYISNNVRSNDSTAMTMNETEFESLMRKSEYAKVYALLLKHKIPYNTNTSTNRHSDVLRIWEMLIRKHNVLKLKLNYESIVAKGKEIDAKLAKLYLDKINEEQNNLVNFLKQNI